MGWWRGWLGIREEGCAAENVRAASTSGVSPAPLMSIFCTLTVPAQGCNTGTLQPRAPTSRCNSTNYPYAGRVHGCTGQGPDDYQHTHPSLTLASWAIPVPAAVEVEVSSVSATDVSQA